MITIEKSRSGHLVAKKNDRWLASSIDPIREAKSWAMNALKSLQDAETALVLGLGSGYHVRALAEQRPNLSIVALECDQEIEQHAATQLDSLKNIKCLVISGSENYAGSQELQRILHSQFAILPFAPSCQVNTEWALGVSKFLYARDHVSFLAQVRERPEFAALLDPSAIRRLQEDAISIKTLHQLFAHTQLLNQERRIWKILEELVQ